MHKIESGSREGGEEKEIPNLLTVQLSDMCSFGALHKSEQAAASSSSDRLEEDYAVRTSINNTHTHL